jgi:hypothetical protein
MNEIENKSSNHYGGDGCETVVDPYGDLLPQCETLKDTYTLLKEVGLDTTVILTGLYRVSVVERSTMCSQSHRIRGSVHSWGLFRDLGSVFQRRCPPTSLW